MQELYQVPKEWQNHRDSSPERHGGLFVKWERGMWQIVETRHFADISNDISDNEHMFEHMFMEPMDIWKSGNPYEGFTETTFRELQTFSRLPFDLIKKENSDSEIPKGETYESYADWYLKNEFSRLLPYLVHIHRQYLSGDLNFSEDYWGYLETYGIEKENF